ncbi:hypothetical protein EI94DRAFT_1700862 [Lactarius quietus]|nr:hypothetical protein EI94DRAFT_1700862 [Lactarius quietus]
MCEQWLRDWQWWKAVDHIDTMSSATISKKDAGGDKNVIDDLPQTHGRKAARLQENAKGRFASKIGFLKVKGMNSKVGRKQVKETRSRKNASLSLEVNLDDTWEDEPVPSEESQNETGEGIDDRIFGSQGEDDNKTIKELKTEVKALKSRCNGYEREIRDLQGTCDMHEKVLEMLRQQIMRLMDAQGILNTTYGGKSYVLIP